MEAMRLNSLVRKAVGTAKGIRIRMDAAQFEMSVLSSILWFKARARCIPAERQNWECLFCRCLITLCVMTHYATSWVALQRSGFFVRVAVLSLCKRSGPMPFSGYRLHHLEIAAGHDRR